ncbi:hypothetical protein FEZ33_01175 [Ruoffia tabacinasalis]|uniref:Uncharacterized protein n=1 Tax=Ruoffia tabacinasalis TaxID=87458 RepID=A0A5R9EJU4_9LACT|nr:hypothetical protein [Ruoffia tabacinasalis]TLQ49275.1 hypothetical protein FEZ33_01175 [Ruoffia tabacinasalis]
MAFQADFINGSEKVRAHSPIDEVTRLKDIELSLSAVDIDSFDFSVEWNHPAIDFINEMKTMIEVINLDTKETMFEGRILSQTGTTDDNQTERRYIAEDCTAFLHDSRQMPKKMTVKPSELVRFLLNRHNSLVEPEKQFAVGTVEIDTYIAYGDSPEAELVKVELQSGDTATIKPSTTKIYDWNGNALNIANYAKGVAHTITDTRMLNGVKQYLLSRTWPSGVTTQEGFINENDIVEAQATVSPGQITEPGGELSPRTKFKIREGVTTYYGASDGGGAKTIPSEYRGYTYTVSSHGLINGMYGMLYNGTVIAWIPSSDVVQIDGRDFEVVTPPESTAPVKVGDSYPPGTKAKIKSGITTYYWSADGTRPTTIPSDYKTKTYTTREWSSLYKRYAIYWNGTHIAWIDESALDFGATPKPTQPIGRDRPVYTEKIRYIDVELSYSDSTYDAIKKYLLDPFGAELEWTKVEEVRTLHVRRRIQNETDEKIMPGLNLIQSNLEVNPENVTTVLIPIGNPPSDEEGEE